MTKDALEFDFAMDFTDEDFEKLLREDEGEGEAEDPSPSPAPAPDNVINALDLGAYEILDAGGRGDSIKFVLQFLGAIHDEYEIHGEATYDCIWKFRHNRVTDADVQMFMQAVRARISRLRKHADVPEFVIVFHRYEILPDNQHVAVQVGRMLRPLWEEWQKKIRAKYAAKVSLDKKAAQLL